ncbi:hypothetical protein D5H75_06850 [Bailinhaonella thermotolerans]|uniref:Uncharacterized protein n=1 Tax=Bailinhaonella thermotolerans TaxID=1070861 RepID=A0A3A4B924_9ACTN|nr:hypothetical protein D5H75_06850 [Bailinhaonella thermotolerans]
MPYRDGLRRGAAVTRGASQMADGDWTRVRACVTVGLMPADPMLVVRRHVDLQRVRSAICS